VMAVGSIHSKKNTEGCAPIASGSTQLSIVPTM
jgi:hypothetical protein